MSGDIVSRIFFQLFLAALATYLVAHAASAESGAPKQKTTYNSLLMDIDIRLHALDLRVAGRPKDWLVRQRLISTLLERAQLTNSVADYAKVEQAVAAAMELAPHGSGPLLQAAQFNYSIHRLDQAEKYLDQMERHAILKSSDQLPILILRSNIAFHRGQYQQALRGYRDCEAAAPSICSRELSIFYANTGGFSEAEALLNLVASKAQPEDVHARAWVALQLGILSMRRGNYPAALKNLAEADKLLPDWWLVREHIAEVHTLMGDDAAAVPIYQEIVQKVQLPQYMDALAGCYLRQGRSREAEELRAKAQALWEEQLKRFPESAAGHALDHFLESSSDSARSLALAEANLKARPAGEARVGLVEALLKANRPKDALIQIEQLLASPYRSAEAFDAAYKTYSALGERENAEKQRVLCLSINPSFYGIKPAEIPKDWLARRR